MQLSDSMLDLILVEDNTRLRGALENGLAGTGEVQVIFSTGSGEEALAFCLEHGPEPGHCCILMDVQLEGRMNGIQSAVAVRREFPRFPVVFYSIQDDDAYYRDFINSGILSHYAYVRKSNYLLPHMILPLIQDACRGRSLIDPEIESRVQQVRRQDANNPLALLEPGELQVARLLAQGLTNEQIAARLGFRDKRTISRTNGQIYAVWGLAENATDEKIARTRAALIVQTGRMLTWDADGQSFELAADGSLTPWMPG